MQGRLVSYTSEKKYGFIKGDDGQSYFFHISSLNNKQDESKLIKNTLINFDPKPTPKGLAAKKLSIPTTFFKKRAVSFFTTKESQPKHGEIESSRSIRTRFFKDIDQAKNKLSQLARESGCNAILDKQYQKQTFSEGNYQYSVHAFRANLAIITEKVACASEVEKNNADNKISKTVKDFQSKAKALEETENNAIKAQLESKSPPFFILFAGFIFLFIIGLAPFLN